MTNTLIIDPLGYIRTSTDLQDGKMQEETINNKVKSLGIYPIPIIKDIGVSGTITDRKGWNEVMAKLRSGERKTLIVYKNDRCFRSSKHFINMMEEFKHKNIRFISLADGIDTINKEDAMSKAFWQMLSVFSELEASIIRQRVMSGQAIAKANGKHIGRPKGSKDKGGQRSKSGYYMRYLGKSRAERRLGRRSV